MFIWMACLLVYFGRLSETVRWKVGAAATMFCVKSGRTE